MTATASTAAPSNAGGSIEAGVPRVNAEANSATSASGGENLLGSHPPTRLTGRRQHPDGPKREPTGSVVSSESADAGGAPTADHPPTPQSPEATGPLPAETAAPATPTSNEAFKPSPEWQTIPKGTAIPEGATVRMDMKTGENYARWDTLPGSRGEPEDPAIEALEAEAEILVDEQSEGHAPTAPAAAGEATPELPVAPSTTKPEEFHVPTRAKDEFAVEIAGFTAAAVEAGKNPLDPAVASEIQENALESVYLKRADALKPGRAEAIKRDPGYKAMREAAAESLKVNAEPGEVVTSEAVDREALTNYLQVQDEDRDKPGYLLRQLKKKLGFGKMIAEILLAVGLSTGEQVGTQSVTPLQPGRT